MSGSMCLLDNLLDSDRARQSAAPEASVFKDLHEGNTSTEDRRLQRNLESKLKDLLRTDGGLFSPNMSVPLADMGRTTAANDCS